MYNETKHAILVLGFLQITMSKTTGSGVVTKPRIFSLYRNILREHKRKLPFEMRQIGDSYVRNEFKLHKNAKPAFVRFFSSLTTTLSSMMILTFCYYQVTKFVHSWERYLDLLKVKEDDIGEHIDTSRLSVDQQIKLEELKLTITKDSSKE